MSENLTPSTSNNNNVELNSSANGTVSFAADVIATIAGLAATEVEGVAAMIAANNLGLVDMLRKNQGNRQLTKGVRVELNQNTVSLHLTINVDYGSPVPDVAREVQDNVKKAVETMTGLEVKDINIYIQGVSFEKENKVAQEQEEMRQASLEMKEQARIERESSETLEVSVATFKITEGESEAVESSDPLFGDEAADAASDFETEPETGSDDAEPVTKRKSRRKADGK